MRREKIPSVSSASAIINLNVVEPERGPSPPPQEEGLNFFEMEIYKIRMNLLKEDATPKEVDFAPRYEPAVYVAQILLSDPDSFVRGYKT